jgi:hypothetical protein
VPDQQQEKQTSIIAWIRRHLAAYIASGLIAGLLVVAFMANPRLHQAFVLAMTRQPEPVTELSFTNANNLPSVALPGQPVSFGFRLTNHTSHETTYHYQVIEATGSGATVVKIGQIAIANGASATISEQVVLTHPNTDTQIIVLLTRPAQHIDLWVHTS